MVKARDAPVRNSPELMYLSVAEDLRRTSLACAASINFDPLASGAKIGIKMRLVCCFLFSHNGL